MKDLRSPRIFLLAGLVLLFAACGKPSEVISLYVGVHDDATLFMDWDNALYYKLNPTSKVEYPQGAKMEAYFGRKYGEQIVSLNLVIKDPLNEVYTVEGTYEAREPFTLTFLGTNQDGAKENQLSFSSGSGKISFKGHLYFTYENKKTSETAKKH